MALPIQITTQFEVKPKTAVVYIIHCWHCGQGCAGPSEVIRDRRLAEHIMKHHSNTVPVWARGQES